MDFRDWLLIDQSAQAHQIKKQAKQINQNTRAIDDTLRHQSDMMWASMTQEQRAEYLQIQAERQRHHEEQRARRRKVRLWIVASITVLWFISIATHASAPEENRSSSTPVSVVDKASVGIGAIEH